MAAQDPMPDAPAHLSAWYWDLARAAADRAGIAIEPLGALADTDRANEVILRVWGAQVLAREVLRALQHAGCVLLGARAARAAHGAGGPVSGQPLVGFVFGFMGFEGGPHLHSHMLAVLPGEQSRGIGYALKLAQAAASLDAGIDDVRWTYDPIVARNAWFNLVKLGTYAAAFLPDFYGEMSDDLNRGDRSDRFEVRWLLRSERVRATMLAGAPPGLHGEAFPADAPVLLEAEGDPEAPTPVRTDRGPGDAAVVAVPRDSFDLRRREPALAARWRSATAEAFQACFDHGLVATAITADGRYRFERRDGV